MGQRKGIMATGGVYAQGYFLPSTRQEPQKMGKFFKKIRQGSVKETARKCQEGAGAGGGVTRPCSFVSPVLQRFVPAESASKLAHHTLCEDGERRARLSGEAACMLAIRHDA